MSTIKGVTAVVAHACDTCSHKIDGIWSTAIWPGHRYLLHTTFPGDPGLEEGRYPVRHRECARCAEQRQFGELLMVGICGSYCCGTEPCALPYEPVGTPAPWHDHTCHRCAPERERVLASSVTS